MNATEKIEKIKSINESLLNGTNNAITMICSIGVSPPVIMTNAKEQHLKIRKELESPNPDLDLILNTINRMKAELDEFIEKNGRE